MPRLLPNISIDGPIYSSGVSTWTYSYGSQVLPSISFKITLGRDTWNSYPSRRKFSIKIDRCNSPRPETIHSSLLLTLSIRKLTSLWVSLNNLSSIFLPVTNVPSFPAKGEVFVPKFICTVGSDTLIKGRASSLPSSQIVSPTYISSRPAIATMSPASASLTSIFLSPKKLYNFCILNFLIVPSTLTHDTISLRNILPRLMRPIPILPT